MSINKIHFNNSTCMTLNDRFTVMQTTTSKLPQGNTPHKKITIRRAQSAASGTVRPPRASIASRKFLERLEQKHKIQTAKKLKRKSLKTIIPARQRIRNRIGLKKGAAAKAMQLTANGKLIRSNSLSNIATMKADLVKPAIKRSNSASNLASRLGIIRRPSGSSALQTPRRPLKRNASIGRQRMIAAAAAAAAARSQSRSRSALNVKRANLKINLRRMNSKGDLNRGREAPPQKRMNRNIQRSSSRTRKRSSSISGRFNRPTQNSLRRRLSQNGINNAGGGGGGVSQGRVFKRRNSTGNVMNKSGAKQGRVSRPRGRGNTLQQQRGRSRSRSRLRNPSVQGRRGGGGGGGRGGRGGGGGPQGRGNQRAGRGRANGRNRGGRAPRPVIKKEDLDKELDQYMANTRTALDKEMDIYMNTST